MEFCRSPDRPLSGGKRGLGNACAFSGLERIGGLSRMTISTQSTDPYSSDFEHVGELALLSPQAKQNWDRLREHAIAEYRRDIETTMATMASNPFQVFHPTGVSIFGYDAVREYYLERFQTIDHQT